MQKTSDYEIFKHHEANRRDMQDGFESRVQQIVLSLKEENLLHIRPIVVDTDMKILDGTHRLEAARRLGLPVYYVVYEGKDPSVIGRLNTQNGWITTNWIDFQASTGNPYCKAILDLSKKIGKSVGYVICLASLPRHKSNSLVSLRRGKMTFDVEEVSKEVMRKHESLLIVQDMLGRMLHKEPHSIPFYQRNPFVRAFSSFMNIQKMSFEVFLNKIPYALDRLGPRAGTGAYIKMLKNAYNWKNPDHLGDTD